MIVHNLVPVARPMLPSEVMHCQKEDHNQTREDIGALEDGKMPVRTTTVELDQLDGKVTQVCWHSFLSPLES